MNLDRRKIQGLPYITMFNYPEFILAL